MINKTMIQFFEWYCSRDGCHWNWFKDQVSYLRSLGITAAWLPPAYKGTRGAESEGYDVYDIYDLGEFDQKGSVRTKYGSKAEYIEAVNAARRAGMEVYADIVLNHMGGAEGKERIRVRKTDPDNRLRFISEPMEIEAWTRFTFPGRKGKYSDFIWDHRCFTGIDHAIGYDGPAIYKIVNDYGDGWEPVVGTEKGNFDYLMLNDIETRNPAVRQELKNWIRWYFKTVSFDGLRLDAVKHINPDFFNEWIDYVRHEVNPNVFVLGEYWLSDDLSVLLKYIDATERRMHLFDAPLHHNFSIASKRKEKYDLRRIFNDTLIGCRPDSAVTFVDNHDTQPLQSLEECTEQWFKPHAYALILLRETGYPCVFYPDLYSTCYEGKDKNGCYRNIEIPKLPGLPLLLELRKTYSYGRQIDYFDHPHCIGWVRQGDPMHPLSGCAVLVSNHTGRAAVKEMFMGQQHTGKIFYDFLGNVTEKVCIDNKGIGKFSTVPGAVSVWVHKQE